MPFNAGTKRFRGEKSKSIWVGCGVHNTLKYVSVRCYFPIFERKEAAWEEQGQRAGYVIECFETHPTMPLPHSVSPVFWGCEAAASTASCLSTALPTVRVPPLVGIPVPSPVALYHRTFPLVESNITDVAPSLRAPALSALSHLHLPKITSPPASYKARSIAGNKSGRHDPSQTSPRESKILIQPQLD